MPTSCYSSAFGIIFSISLSTSLAFANGFSSSGNKSSDVMSSPNFASNLRMTSGYLPIRFATKSSTLWLYYHYSPCFHVKPLVSLPLLLFFRFKPKFALYLAWPSPVSLNAYIVPVSLENSLGFILSETTGGIKSQSFIAYTASRTGFDTSSNIEPHFRRGLGYDSLPVAVS